ncbi:MAG: arsenate reductase (glutaredoxin) [Ekhidna sp.]|uniref:arsenate reductase (glutaredoxin) n=1 Tax=Ekhidna sp. TaxID=2608089 RepID=UPI0032ED8AC2
MITIYHNPRCTKSRQTLSLIENKGRDFVVKEYLKNPPSKDELKEVVKKLGIKPAELIRKGEAEFKEYFKGKDLSDDEWLDAMVKFPKLIERPIVIEGDKAVLGRPPENVLELL